MQARPVSPGALVELVAEQAARLHPRGRVRVALDGAPTARPGELADALVDPLRLRGRPALRVPAAGFLRARSLRLERGRTDPDAYYDDWLDVDGLRRELLDPLGPGGSGRYLPSLRDAVADRASRAPYADAPAAAVLLVDGALLLGRGLPFDLTVHLALSPAALARRTEPGSAWTLAAYARYEREVRPAQVADLVVRVDDARRPALVTPRG